jgi:sorbitol-specific phosphotransferase system component IIBC
VSSGPDFSTFDNQLIYRLAAIETKLTAIGDKFESSLARLEAKQAEGQKEMAADVAKLEARVEANEKKLAAVEKRWDNLTAKVGGVVSVVSVFWMMFGSTLENSIKNVF